MHNFLLVNNCLTLSSFIVAAEPQRGSTLFLTCSLDPVFCAELCIVEKSIRVGWMSIFRGKRSSFRSFFKLRGVNKIFSIVCARMSFHNPCARDFTSSRLFVRMQKIEIFLINIGKYGVFSFI